MYEIIEILNRSEIVSQLEIMELIDESSVQSIKIKVKIIDSSFLFIRETTTERGNKYSYHWQKEDNTLLVRWDNAPHYRDIETFPDHRHIERKIEASPKMSIKEILQEIEKKVKQEMQ